MNETDIKLLRRAFEIALSARAKGNHPFGSLLADENGRILLEAENTVRTERDCTGHAETNLMRLASKNFEPDFLAKCTLYTSAEPCAMCSTAIYWGNVGRMVYALSTEGLHGYIGNPPENRPLLISSREIFERSGKQVEVVGPALEDEAVKVHEGFWQ